MLYGRGFKSIDDKKDALLGHKYHLALENGGAPFTWTELNLAKRFASLAIIAFDKRISSPKPNQKGLIRSERSLWPEKDSRGSVFEHLTRAALIKIWPTAELSIANKHKSREVKRLAVRKARVQREEKQIS